LRERRHAGQRTGAEVENFSTRRRRAIWRHGHGALTALRAAVSAGSAAAGSAALAGQRLARGARASRHPSYFTSAACVQRAGSAIPWLVRRAQPVRRDAAGQALARPERRSRDRRGARDRCARILFA